MVKVKFCDRFGALKGINKQRGKHGNSSFFLLFEIIINVLGDLLFLPFPFFLLS